MPERSSAIRVLAITRKPHSASFEQRIANFIEPLRTLGIDVETCVYPKKLARQIATLSRVDSYDVVWWHRHLLPWWQMRLLRRYARYLVYDFDDPVCFSTRDDGSSSVRSRRFARLIAGADAVMAGSHYLGELALAYNDNVHIVPMAIDLPDYEGGEAPRVSTELLWLGSASTQKYLDLIRPALEKLGQTFPQARLRLVAHTPMSFGDLETKFVQWTPQSQDQALAECAIGLCPMPDTVWSRGKCPYKVLQYMSYGMAWIGSAVGENIVTAGPSARDDARGLTAANTDEWLQGLERLLTDAAGSIAMGRRARSYIEQHHERQHIARLIAGLLRRDSDSPLGHA
ncbi:MAG: glycosyltransferase family 4 protein [Gammaproteobacteria bacterium]|nr:glycosyltransferase family 4 protein [Gammaproteobacteria bacterium]